MTMTPVTITAAYQLIISILLAFLGWAVHKTDPATFQMIVGALIVQITGGTIHVGRQASVVIKGNADGNGH